MRITRAALYALAASFCGISVGQEARTTLHIEPQPIRLALKDLGEQTGLQIMVRSEDVARDEVTVPRVTGRLSAKEALDKMLSNTGLQYRFVNSNTVLILSAAATVGSQPPPSMASTEGQGEGAKKSSEDSFRMAQGNQAVPAEPSPIDKNNPEGLQEVIVTAQKREQRLLDVPISIVALGTDDLQNRKLTSLDDLQFAVPGMAVSTDGFGSKIELRGVSNTIGTTSLIGVYLDEADVTNSGGTQINPNTYDLERVEVLRGPQGTLYGEGSAGGTIRFITKSPTLDRFGMTASVASQFTQDGSPGEHIDTAVNVPLIENVLGLRLVGAFHREGGWIDQPDAGLKDINGQDLTNVRVKSLWKPTERFSASFMAEIYRNDRSTGTNDDVSGNFIQVFGLTTTPKVSEDHDIYNLTLTYDFPGIKVLSATSYFREKIEGQNLGYTFSGAPGEPSYGFLTGSVLSNDHAAVEELRLSSVGSGPMQWTVGGLYRNYRDVVHQGNTYYDLSDAPLPAPSPPALGDTLFKSWSFFGDINYTLWRRITLGFGARSFQEIQDNAQVADYGFGPTKTEQTGKFHSVDPRAYAQYKLSRDINFYASAAKGFRSGGFNADPAHPTYEPEDVRTYELGTKMSLLEGQLHAETAFFYTDYRDYVVAGSVHLGDLYTPYLNVGAARLKGVDWDFVWRLSSQWSLGINGDYIDTRFTKVNATSTAYEVGDPLDYVPKYQMASFAERDFTWQGKQASIRLDYTRRGRMTYRYRSEGAYSETDVINLLGCYMNLRWNENLSFNLFAQNLLNDRGLIVPDSGASTRSRPRTYGVGFDASL